VVVSGADIWLGDQFLGTVLACDFRSDLKQAGIGRGYCSFRFVTPVSIPAASLRLLTVTRITDGSALQMTSHLRSLLSDRFSPLEAGLSARPSAKRSSIGDVAQAHLVRDDGRFGSRPLARLYRQR
jgi:hypothetical protein